MYVAWHRMLCTQHNTSICRPNSVQWKDPGSLLAESISTPLVGHNHVHACCHATTAAVQLHQERISTLVDELLWEQSVKVYKMGGSDDGKGWEAWV